jgi:hypothetical protein
MKIRLIMPWALALLSLFLSFQNASAQWYFNQEENAFDDSKSTNIAITGNTSGYGFGLRCIGEQFALVLITPEKIESVGPLNAAKPKILLRVDKNKSRSFDAEIYTANENVAAQAILNKEDFKAVSDEISNARSRVSVAIEILSENIHNVNFGTSRSGRTIKSLTDACTALKEE